MNDEQKWVYCVDEYSVWKCESWNVVLITVESRRGKTLQLQFKTKEKKELLFFITEPNGTCYCGNVQMAPKRQSIACCSGWLIKHKNKKKKINLLALQNWPSSCLITVVYIQAYHKLSASPSRSPSLFVFLSLFLTNSQTLTEQSHNHPILCL